MNILKMQHNYATYWNEMVLDLMSEPDYLVREDLRECIMDLAIEWSKWYDTSIPQWVWEHKLNDDN